MFSWLQITGADERTLHPLKHKHANAN